MGAEKAKRKFSKEDRKHIGRIFGYVWPYRFRFLAGFVLMILGSLTSLSIPYFLKEMLDVNQGNSKYFSSISALVIAFAAVLILQSIFSYSRTILMTYVTEHAIADVRRSLYEKLITSPIQLFDKSRVGELTSRIAADATVLQETIAFTMPQFVRQVLTIIIGISILTVASPKLTVSVLATIPVVVLVGYFFGTFIRKLSRKRQDKLAESNVVVDETFTAFRSVKAFANELFERNRYSSKMTDVIDISMKTARYRGLFFAFITLCMGSAMLFVVWRASQLLSSGDLSVGELVMFIAYTGFIAGSIGGLPNTITSLLKTIGATERIEELMQGDTEFSLTQSNGLPFDFEEEVEFNSVGFAYPSRPDQQVLQEISFKINKGQKVAIVGHSGAGKSTIAQLILRFYNVDTGFISIDGNDIESLDLQQYRNHVGFVPQDVLLFGGTIRENIAYGNLDASENEVLEAATRANALEFIEKFSDGLDTVVGERGIQLSGGQKQRVAIARALLKNPTILILDEATSALDAESEFLVQQALELLMESRTTLIIAHRLSTVRKADHILVLKDGKIVESGSHEDLLNQKGYYENLVGLQLR